MEKKLTDVFCQKVKPLKDRAEYLDPTGLRLVVQPSGKKSWAVRARLHDKQIKVTLGKFPGLSLKAARDKAKHVFEQVEHGTDPRIERKKDKDNTVKAVFERWMRDEQCHRRGHRETRRLFEKRILPEFGARPVSSVGPEEVAAFLDDIAEEVSDTRSRRVRAALRRLFEFAVEKFIIKFNPVAAVRPRGDEKSRDRHLADSEVKDVWNAAERLKFPLGPYCQLVLLTGARRAEILHLRWSEIDFDEQRIMLSGSRTKNGQPHITPLSGTALDILKGLPRFKDCPYVFTTNGKTPCSDSKIKASLEAFIEDEMEDWRVHDFRRTVAVNLQRMGYTLPVIESVLGHVSGSKAGIVGVYQVYDFLGERKKALDEWEQKVLEVIADKKKKAVAV